MSNTSLPTEDQGKPRRERASYHAAYYLAHREERRARITPRERAGINAAERKRYLRRAQARADTRRELIRRVILDALREVNAAEIFSMAAPTAIVEALQSAGFAILPRKPR